MDPLRLRRPRRSFVETADHAGHARRGPRRSCPTCTHVWQVDDGAIDELEAAGGRTSATSELAEATAGRRPRRRIATIIYTSGTTGRPKGCSSPTATSWRWPTTPSPSSRSFVKADDASTLLFLPLAHVFAPVHRGRLRRPAGARWATPPTSRTCSTTSASSSRRSSCPCRASSRRSTTRAEAKAHRRRQGQDLRPRPSTRDRLVRGARQRRRRPRAAQAAARACSTSSSTASCAPRWAARCMYAVSGGAPARHPPRALLPRHRRHRPRGLRPHRDHRARHGQRRRTAIKIGTVGAAAARRRPSASPTTARSSSAATTSSRATTTTTTRPPRRDRRTAGSTPATSASSTRTATSRSPAARRSCSSPPAARTSPRPSSRTALRAHPLVSQCIVVGDQKPFIAALITLDEEMYPGLGQEQRHRRGQLRAGPHRRDGPQPSCRRPSTTPTSRCPRPSRSASSRCSTGDFTEENGYLTPEPEAQAQHRHEGLPRPGGGPLLRRPGVTSTV